MKTGILIGLMMAAFATSGAWAESAQQSRMKTCNDDAKKQTLAGDARKSFMKSCLSGAMADAKPAVEAKPVAAAAPAAAPTGMSKSGKPMTAQQQRMKDCNAEAKSKEMKGDPRKAFMKSCLSNKK
ncbi:MAG: PsiF family protein [Thiobacillaceae bacterium]